MGEPAFSLDVRIPLLQWLPGETFYSLCARHHRFSGFPTSAHTTQALFGHSRSGCQHDLPSRLDAFVQRVDGVHGDAERIARERTLLKFYAHFHRAAVVEDAVASLRSTSVAHLKYRLGLLTSRFRANHPLKACPTCMESDVRTHGWTFWHIHHQFPGVWLCPQHEQPLLEATVKANGVQRFTWQLPSADSLHPACMDGSDDAVQAHRQLSTFILAVTHAPERDGWLEPANLQAAFRYELDQRGLLTAGGNVRIKEFAADYSHHCQLLRSPPELQALPATTDEAAVELGRLLRQLRSGLHPIRFLAACSWLFGSAAEFRQVLTLSRSGETGTKPAAEFLAVAYDDAKRLEFARLIEEGASARSASRAVGIATNTGLAWAAATGQAVATRPKVLKSEVRANLENMLRRGCEKAEAAAAAGIAVGTVDRLFQQEPRLHAAWTEIRRARLQRQARSAWLRAVKGTSIKLARQVQPAAYGWLYRNDRAWLQENSPARQRQQPASSVRWDERDVAIASAVEKAVLTLCQTSSHPLQLWQVCQLVPELHAKRSRLSRLPLTQQALERGLGPRPRKNSPPSNIFDV